MTCAPSMRVCACAIPKPVAMNKAVSRKRIAHPSQCLDCGMLVDGLAPNNVLRGAGICGIDRADIPGSPPRYRARFFSPDRRQSRHPQENKMRAARDAGDLPIPTVSSRKKERDESCSHHGFRVFPERPAHGVLGLLRTNPGGLTWPPLLRTGRSLSTAGRGPTPDAPYLGYERPRPG